MEAEHEGERLDHFVAGALGLSRGYVRRLLQRGRVSLAGDPAVKGSLLRTGDRIRIEAFRHPDEGPIPTPGLELPLLEQAHGLVAFDKPAGMPTHPHDYEETATALNAALARFPELARIGDGALQAGLLHRLDTDTSGVLVFALEQSVWDEARAVFASRRVDKRYVARVHGVLEGSREVRLRLDHRGPRMRVVARGGREGVLRLGKVRPEGDTSLVEIELVTGLMHQIRASLAYLGHPLVGDRLYGSSAADERHWLHACSIRIVDFRARSEPPPELGGRGG